MKRSACSSHRKYKRLNEFPDEVVARLCCKGDEFGSEAKLQVQSLPRGLVLLQCLCCCEQRLLGTAPSLRDAAAVQSYI